MQTKNPKKHIATIADVAKEAKVSTATVSRVLNGPAGVRESLRTRVEAAVQRLGYVPNASARALMVGSRIVGAIVPTIDHAIFAKGIDALQHRLAAEGLQLLIATSDNDPAIEASKAQSLVFHGAQGLVVCGRAQTPDLLDFLRRRGTPTVHVMVHQGDSNLHCVGLNNVEAMKQVVRYLTGLGHTEIAMLAGLTTGNDRAAGRVEGVRRGMRAAGLTLRKDRLLERRYDVTAAREGLRLLLARQPMPTAIVCGNDVLAQGALLEALSMGLKVPEEISIVGFDDLPITEHLSPPLTTVRIQTDLMWRTAAEHLLALIQGEQPDPIPPFETLLVQRGSTAPPRRKL